eukprot:11113018-Alexandrium_andersonii.AAC.1
MWPSWSSERALLAVRQGGSVGIGRGAGCWLCKGALRSIDIAGCSFAESARAAMFGRCVTVSVAECSVRGN